MGFVVDCEIDSRHIFWLVRTFVGWFHKELNPRHQFFLVFFLLVLLMYILSPYLDYITIV